MIALRECNGFQHYLEERFGKIGETIKSNIYTSRFPNTYHHDFLRALIEKVAPEYGALSRGEVSRLLRETVTDEEERELELLKGAIAYILTCNEGAILNEILDSKDMALVESYSQLRAFAEDIWITKLKSSNESVGG